jgi:Zn-dependent peptidase ImmA (M78 family)
MIVINDDKPTDRVRYSSAHEVGHLVLHTSPRGKPADLDKEADLFAAEFLLPAEAMRREIPSPLTLTDLAKLKPRWGVSIQALVVRAYHLDIITERQYRYMFEQISKLGWRTKEPENLDIPKEKPRLLRKLAELSFGVPVVPEKVAHLINAPTSFVTDLLSVCAEHKEMPIKEEKQLTQEVVEVVKNNKVLKFKR